MESKNVFLLIRHSKTAKIRYFGLLNQDKLKEIRDEEEDPKNLFKTEDEKSDEVQAEDLKKQLKKSSVSPVDLSTIKDMNELLPIFEYTPNASIIDMVDHLITIGLPTIDIKNIKHLGELINHEAQINYKCFELDCTEYDDKDLPGVDWYEAKDIARVCNVLFLSLIFKLFTVYYFDVYGD